MSGFHFSPGTIFENYSGLRDTTRDKDFLQKSPRTIGQLKDLEKLSIFPKNSSNT